MVRLREEAILRTILRAILRAILDAILTARRDVRSVIPLRASRTLSRDSLCLLQSPGTSVIKSSPRMIIGVYLVGTGTGLCMPTFYY